MKNFIIWFWYFVITSAFYAFGQSDEKESRVTGLVALTTTHIVLFVILLARTYRGE